ncbi:hypothetical protein SNE40_012058 [Patella caerulea]|uniref:Uncharacterized protein n=2 Tax=Patella caerulea TaxID=87958 RepID=A0AAN8PQ52_PATCE
MKPEVEELKKQGNESMKEGKPAEAVFHYTHAIKIDPKNHILYSNRSSAFLKIEQYYLALQDAITTTKLEPTWPKGYFRKGEVEFQAGDYPAALKSYKHAFVLDTSDEGIKQAMSKTTKEINKQLKVERQQPLTFAGIGGAIGIIIVTADQYLANQPSIPHWIFQIILIAILAVIGFFASKLYRYMLSMQQSSLLDPPPDILSDLGGTPDSNPGPDSEKEIPQHRTGQKGGRQRYKKGKS